MRVLVTGGAGYIGSHVVRELQRHGHEPVVYDNLSTGFRFLAGDAEFIQADIGDDARASEALSGIDAVMHFAAFSSVAESLREPTKYFQNNVIAARRLLECVQQAGTPYFIFSSSAAVYGVPPIVPIPDDAPCKPINPYGQAKLVFEQELESRGARGLRWLSLRYFNAAGADEEGGIGECHFPETHLIPLALEAVVGRRGPVDIYGTDYPTPDGTCIRDYVHVNDLAEAHVRGLKYLEAGGPSRAFNLGTGHGNSVKEVLDAVEQVTGRPLKRNLCGRRQGDPPVLVADASQGRAQLGWQATRTLPEMVSSAWNWLRTFSRLDSH